MGLSGSVLTTVARTRRWLFAENAVYGKLLLSSLLGVGAIGLLAAAFVAVAIDAHRSDIERRRAVDVVRFASEAESELANLERDYRSYLATRAARFGERFHRRRDAVTGAFLGLEGVIAEQPREIDWVQEARKAARQWLQDVALPGLKAAESGETALEVPWEKTESLHRAREALRSLREDETLGIQSEGKLADRSVQVLAYASRMEALFRDMEQVMWENAATGSPESAMELRNAVAEFEGIFGHLSILLEDRKSQMDALKEIHTGVNRWRRGVADKTRHPGEGGAVLNLLVESDADAAAVRERLDAFEEAELSQFESASRQERVIRTVKTAGFVGVAVFAILLLLGSGGYSFVAYRRHLRKLETAEAQTRSILETTLDGVITVDRQGIIRTMNPAAERMFESSAQDLIGKSFSKIVPQRLFMHDITNLGRGTIMAMGQRQNLYPFPIEVSVSEIAIDGRRQFVASIRDVTERKRSEETLRHIGIGVSSTTGREFIRSLVVHLSKALQTDCAFILPISGRSGNGGHTLFLAENGSLRSVPCYRIEGSSCEEIVRRGFQAWPQEVRSSFPDDALLEELNAESFVAMPLKAYNGRTIGVLGVVDRKPTSDLAQVKSTLQIFGARAGAEIQRQQVEEALSAEKERLSVTLNSISEGCVAVDVDGNVELLNPAAERLTGWTGKRAVGRPLTEVLHVVSRANRESCEPALEQLVEKGIVTGLDDSSILIAADGTERVVECSAAPIRDVSNHRVGVVLFFRDMTERERTEDERRKAEKLESLGVAAGGIAHDFNNLLTVILGNLSLVMMSQESEENLHERLTVAKNASVRAQDLAQQLLTFARGGTPLRKTEPLAPLICETVVSVLRGTDVRCEFEIAEDLWPGDIDPGQIGQVLANIALNANQAMPEGGTLHVSASNFERTDKGPAALGLASGRYAKLLLSDEGEGIPPENLGKIFDPYFTTRIAGSGLGLATAYSIVRNHGGVITVESTVGNGASFGLYLPAASVDALSAVPVETVAPVGPGRVLVLDDEEVICELVSCTLERKGYSVIEAYDAATAIRYYEEALAQNRRFDVVISDLTMPGGMGGQEAIKRLREIDPTVKAIVSSGYAMDPVMSRYQEYGFCACLAKPYEVSALGRLVDEVYGGNPNANDRERVKRASVEHGHAGENAGTHSGHHSHPDSEEGVSRDDRCRVVSSVSGPESAVNP